MLRAMKRACTLGLLALFLLLTACQTRPAAQVPLPTSMLACRAPASVATLQTAGAEFQRAADAELASGRCRRFAAGSGVLGLAGDRFTDPASGQTFWIFH